MCERSGRTCQYCHKTWAINEPEIICTDARKNGALCQPSLTVIMRRETEPLCLDCAVNRADARSRHVSRIAGGRTRNARHHVEKWRRSCAPKVAARPELGQAWGSKPKQEADGGRPDGGGLGTGVETLKEEEREEM